jgi:voltage-gated potassium channel Kch
VTEFERGEAPWNAGPVSKLRSLPRQSGHYIVCGGNALARRLVDDLLSRYQVTVIAIVPTRTGNQTDDEHVEQIRKLLPPNQVISQDRITDETLDAAWISTARGIALVDEDDQIMIQAALRAENRNKDIRIVVRMFNQRLGDQIKSQLGNCAALSGSLTAAPAFANEALSRPYSVDVGDRSICVTHNPSPDSPRLCVLADRVDRNNLLRMRILPERSEPGQPGRAVLRFVEKEPVRTISSRARLLWWLTDVKRQFSGLQLRVVIATMITTVITSFALIWALGGRAWWAVYTTLLDLANSAQPDVPGEPHTMGTGGAWQRAAQVSLTFCGIAFIPIVTAILLTRLENRRGGLPKKPGAGIRDHVIVLGLGNLGTRIATYLDEAGIPVVALERNAQARGVNVMRDKRIPVVMGDDPMETRLQRAGLERSRAIVAATSDDAVNLEAILEARTVMPNLRAVLRLFDDEFSYLVYGKFKNIASRSVSFLAAPAFAAALMGHEVLGTLTVFRQIFIVAELQINQNSGLTRQSLRELESSAQLRVIATRPGPNAVYDWTPNLARHPQTGDRIVAVATASGFSWLHSRNGNPN